MKDMFQLNAAFRDDQGKGASRRLRHEGKLPAILYGGGEEPRSLVLEQQELMMRLNNEAFASHILTIKVGDVEQQAVLKDLQRHPFKSTVLHADFLRVVAGQELKVNVPLHFIGEEEAPGKRAGGIVNHMLSDTEVACLPRNLPEYLEIDVSELEIDEILHLSDIKLPKGVELTELAHGQDSPVVMIARPQKEEEEEVEDAEGEGIAGAPEADDAAKPDED